MFWGLVLEPAKRYTKVVDNPFHISAAVLDTSALDDEFVRVFVEVEECETLIANLSLKHGILQSPLDLQFESGSHVAFYTTGGKCPVHLSGYVIFDDEEVYGNEEEETSDEDIAPLVPSPTVKTGIGNEIPVEMIDGRRAFHSETKQNKEADEKAHKRKTEDKAVSLHKKARVMTQEVGQLFKQDLHMNEDSEDTSDAESDDSEEEDCDYTEKELPNFTPEVERMKNAVKLGGDDDEEDTSEELPETQTPRTEVPIVKDEKTPNSEKKAPLTEAQTPRAGVSTPKSKKTPKAENKSTMPEAQILRADGPAVKSGKTPKSEKKAISSEAQTPKAEDKTPKKKSKQTENLAKDSNKSKSTQGTPQSASKSPKVVKKGGVTCEDLTVGSGPEAKHGKMVSVYYEGRLLNSKKVFDKLNSGKGLKFRVGYGEVIQGWDIGIIGMKVGGKRRIICPPHMAYGKKGVVGIPPQSTLVFIVELKTIY